MSNNMRSFVLSTSITAGILTLVLIGLIQVGEAQIRSSSNYQIQSDSINVGGGLSTSTNFRQESTVGEVATGFSTSTSYQLRAGYQQMQEVFLSLSAAADVVLSPGLPGITGGTANGSTSVTVVTDGPAGYQLTIESATDPTLQSGSNSIADLDTSTPRLFDFTSAGSQQAALAFSPTGPDVIDVYRSSGSTCGSGSVVDLRCWEGPSTTPAVIAEAPGSNHPSGASTTINFRVVIDNGANIIAGEYTGTSTITAIPL